MKLRPMLLVLVLACTGSSQDTTIVVEASSPAIVDGSLVESIGLETVGGAFAPLLEVGCKLPCEVTNTFSTATDNQGELSIALARGTKELMAQNYPLGRFVIRDIPPAPRGEPKIVVTLRATGGAISLAARKLSGSQVRLVREPG